MSDEGRARSSTPPAARSRPWSTASPRSPFQGVGGHRARRAQARPRRCAVCRDYPADGDKRVPDLQDGARELRPARRHGDLQPPPPAQRRPGRAARRCRRRRGLGAKDLMWFPSASFPCHEPVIDLMETGRGAPHRGQHERPPGRLLLRRARCAGSGVLRSHGGRWQAIQDGEVKIDIAVIAAPTADAFGNCQRLPRPLGLRLAGLRPGRLDLRRPRHRGHRQPGALPLHPVADPGQQRGLRGRGGLDRRPVQDRLRHHADHQEPRPAADRRVGGPPAPRRRHHARRLLVPGRRRRHRPGLRRLPAGDDARGRGQGPLRPRRLHEVPGGDAPERGADRLHPRRPDLRPGRGAVASPRTRATSPTSPFTSYNFHGKGNFASMVDAVVLGATEVDVNFNANVVTHSDGRLLHGIGGWQNCLHCRLHDPGGALVPRPDPGDRGRGDHPHRARRADRRRGHRARHRHQSPAHRTCWTRCRDPTCRSGRSRRSRPRWNGSAADRRRSRGSPTSRWR